MAPAGPDSGTRTSTSTGGDTGASPDPATRRAAEGRMDPLRRRPRPHGRPGRPRPGGRGPLPRAALGRRGPARQRPRDARARRTRPWCRTRREPLRPTSASVLVWLGLLFYGSYNYAYYAFGTAFNDVFLLHVAAFSASVAGLVLLGSSIDPVEAARGVAGGTRARVVAAFTTLVGLALLGAWGATSMRFAVTGELPRPSCRPPRCTSSTPSTWACSHRPSSSPGCCCGGASVGCRAGRRRRHQRCGVPRRALGRRWVPGGCRHPGHLLAVARGDRLRARVRPRDPGPARAPAPRSGGGTARGAHHPPGRVDRLGHAGRPRRRPRASRGGCRPSTSRAWAHARRSTSPARAGRRGESRTA